MNPTHCDQHEILLKLFIDSSTYSRKYNTEKKMQDK